jgi:peptide/nickel transport system permease protein
MAEDSPSLPVNPPGMPPSDSAPGESSAPASPVPQRPSQGYWMLVWQQFRNNRIAYYSLLMIGFLFLIAAWAPLIVNGKPFVWHKDGVTQYPLFQYLFAPSRTVSVDYFYNYFLVATLAVPLAFLIRRFAMPSLSARRTALLGMVLAALPFIGSPDTWRFKPSEFDVGILRRWRNDELPYPEMAKSLDKAKGDYAIFALVAADPLTPTPAILKEPGDTGILGTDKDGRDVFARMVHGTRISMSVGFVAVLIEVVIGVFFGALAGYFRGWVDVAISRFIELVICFPSFFLILTILAFIDPENRSIFHIMLIIGITGWTGVARLVRGEFLKLAEQDFVQSARALGCPHNRLMFRHILPNAMAPVLVSAAFGVAGAILTESGLAFLGFGAPPPTPTWGEMISQGKEHVDVAWWLIVFPGLSIFLTVTIYNLAGDGLRDAMDPKMRK